MRIVVYVSICLLFLPIWSWSKPDSDKRKITREDYHRLKVAIDSKNEEAVVNAASVILSKDSKDIKALNGLGFFYLNEGQLGIAKLIYRRALRNHRDKPGLHNNLGVIYLAEGDLRKAMVSLKESVALNKSYNKAKINLSSIFVNYQDYSRAIEPLESGYKSIKSKLGSKNDSAIRIANNYAVALMGIGQGEDAEDVFKSALKAGVTDAFLLYNYAILLINVLKKKSDAIRIVSKLKFNTEDPKILNKVEELEQRLDKL